MSISKKFGDSPHVLAVSFLSLSTALACNVVDTTSDVAKAGVSKTVRVASYDELGLGGTNPTPEECDALFADSNGTDFESPREDPEGESGSGLMAPGGGAAKKKSKTIVQRIWERCFGTKEDPENPSAGGPGTNGPGGPTDPPNGGPKKPGEPGDNNDGPDGKVWCASNENSDLSCRGKSVGSICLQTIDNKTPTDVDVNFEDAHTFRFGVCKTYAPHEKKGCVCAPVKTPLAPGGPGKPAL
jgi:hypothetical protein